MQKFEFDFESDPWVYVITDSKEQARRFFGCPPYWPCKFHGFDSRGRGRVFAVKTPLPQQ